MLARILVNTLVIAASLCLVAYLLFAGLVLMPFVVILLAIGLVSGYLSVRVLLLGWPGIAKGELQLTTSRKIHGFLARILGTAVVMLGLAALIPLAKILMYFGSLR